MKRTSKKLVLGRETLRALDAGDLAEAAGGDYLVFEPAPSRVWSECPINCRPLPAPRTLDPWKCFTLPPACTFRF